MVAGMFPPLPLAPQSSYLRHPGDVLEKKTPTPRWAYFSRTLIPACGPGLG